MNTVSVRYRTTAKTKYRVFVEAVDTKKKLYRAGDGWVEDAEKANLYCYADVKVLFEDLIRFNFVKYEEAKSA